ncbi:MAG: hypothetical protein ACNYWU_00890 [Desulfobacterales bacterium]
MEWLEVVMEEYKTLRQESLTSMQMQQSILNFGTATVGIALSGGFAAWDKTPLPEFIFLFLIPIVIYLIVLVWLGEVGRMFRAGNFLCELEEKVNSQFSEKEMALTWETWLSRGEWLEKKPHHVIRFHYISIFTLFMVTALASILFGNYKIHGALSIKQIGVINILEILPFVAVLAVSFRVSKMIAHGQSKPPMIKHNHANSADAKNLRG